VNELAVIRAREAEEGRLFGRGLAFPVRLDGQGRVAWSVGATSVRESIRIILTTEPGEHLNLPEFGARLRGFLFSPNTPATRRLVRDEPSALWPEHLVTVCVIEVPMRVDREIDGAAAELADLSLVLRHHLRELIVDDEHAVRADREEDVAADAEQHVEIRRDLLRRDRRRSQPLVEIVELRGSRQREHEA
jgi:hypothetical protein